MSSSPAPDTALRIVVLAGGIGSRFWPASTPSHPKPLLALGRSRRPLLVETVERALGLVPPDRLAILTGERLVSPFLRVLPELTSDRFWVEPRARGTGPALAWAAHRIHRTDPDAVMVSLHSDHLIEPESAFLELLPRVADLSLQEDRLFTIGVLPDRPETGYGYIRPGEAFPLDEGAEGWQVDAFIEKPDAETAAEFVSRGYLWNSGMFVFPVARFLDEIRRHAPEIADHLDLLDRGREAAFFDAVPLISVDEAVLERSSRVGTVPATFRWDDVGSWEALTRTRPLDVDGNCWVGEVHAVRSRDSIVWAERGSVVLFGVDDLIVVRSGEVTLVTSRARAPELKELLAGLPRRLTDPEAAPGGAGAEIEAPGSSAENTPPSEEGDA